MGFIWKVVRKEERMGVRGVLMASGWPGSMYLMLVKVEEGSRECKDL